MASHVSVDLIEAYLAARYRVAYGPVVFSFRVQEYSGPLASMLADTRQSTAFFITAHNPYSEARSQKDNSLANQALRADLETVTKYVFEATGEDNTGEWPPEPGFLVLGASLEIARAIGHRYEQNAIVWSEENAVPQLLMLR